MSKIRRKIGGYHRGFLRCPSCFRRVDRIKSTNRYFCSRCQKEVKEPIKIA